MIHDLQVNLTLSFVPLSFLGILELIALHQVERHEVLPERVLSSERHHRPPDGPVLRGKRSRTVEVPVAACLIAPIAQRKRETEVKPGGFFLAGEIPHHTHRLGVLQRLAHIRSLASHGSAASALASRQLELTPREAASHGPRAARLASVQADLGRLERLEHGERCGERAFVQSLRPWRALLAIAPQPASLRASCGHRVVRTVESRNVIPDRKRERDGPRLDQN